MTSTKNNNNDELKGKDKFVINMTKTVDDKYTVVHNDSLQHYIKVGVVEEQYDAKYVGEFTVRGTRDGGWANQPVMLFWSDKAHPQGSNWFILYFNYRNSLVIADGISAAEHEWSGVLDTKTNHVLYSAYRHDYQTFDGLMADGGPEYLRSSVHPSVKIKILNGGGLEIKHLLEKEVNDVEIT